MKIQLVDYLTKSDINSKRTQSRESAHKITQLRCAEELELKYQLLVVSESWDVVKAI